MANVIRHLDLETPEIEKYGARFWVPFAQRLAELESPASRDALAFLLAIGLRNVQDHPEELVAATFSYVDDAIEKDQLTDLAWPKLQPVLSSGGIGVRRGENRSRQLRMGLVARFVESEWPAEQFVRCFRDAATLERTLASVKYSKLGRKLSQRLVELEDADLAQTTPAVAHVIRSIRQR